MLNKDPFNRITLSQIMLHPWISKYKDHKMKREWGYSSSSDSSDSLVIEEELEHPSKQTGQAVDIEEMSIPEYLLTSH